MQHKEHCGWYNYETWSAALWCDNDHGLYSYLTEEAQRCFDEAEGTTEERINDATPELAKVIESMFDQDVEEYPPHGWMADAINAYLGEVDWQEIAEHYMDDVDKSSAEEEESEE